MNFLRYSLMCLRRGEERKNTVRKVRESYNYVEKHAFVIFTRCKSSSSNISIFQHGCSNSERVTIITMKVILSTCESLQTYKEHFTMRMYSTYAVCNNNLSDPYSTTFLQWMNNSRILIFFTVSLFFQIRNKIYMLNIRR